jgi:subtilase family serine protease
MNARNLNGWIAMLVMALIGARTDVASAGAADVPQRVLSVVNDTETTLLTGNTHPLAKPEFDRGLVEPGRRLERMILVLKRSPDQDRALTDFNERQQDTASADYHHWLDADEFGRLYGPNDDDIAAVTRWLTGHGFEIYHVNEGKVSIEFSGNVAQVQQAFHVEMHRYLVDDVEHIANDRDPRIPRALAPVLGGVASLNDFRPKPQSILGGYVRRDLKTDTYTRLTPPPQPGAHGAGIQPQLGYVGNDGLQHEDLTPYDFATIYNSLPLWNASTPIIGTGVKVAIAGGSDIRLSDVATFRSSFGLPPKVPTIVHNGADAGFQDDQSENTLDVEMAGAAAPGASITLVVSAPTSTDYGFELSMQYIVSKQTADIMSASYGICELGLGSSGNAFFNGIFQQGATEGISIFISSGDQGSAGCDGHQTTPDEIGLAVNGLASSPYVTGVGGTDFTWSFIDEPVSTYWNSTANAQGATAKGYIPEVPWNSTCVNPLLLKLFVDGSGNPFKNSEALCNAAYSVGELAGIIAGSGGVSNCTTPTGDTTSSCAGGYPKPSWQTGTGVPADGKRDVPDLSLFASIWVSGGVNGSAILFCSSASYTDGCDYSNPNYIIYQEIGGTSASSPYMAGVMALVMQKTGSKLGLANPTFYKLAASDTLSACKSSSVAADNACVFYDQTSGTIAQPCFTGGPNCTTNTAGDAIGILSGYSSTSGYDRATGLGSVNIANLVNSWPSASPAPAVTVSPVSLTFASTTVGSTSATQVVTVKNTGKVAVTLSSAPAITGTNASSFTKSTTCGTSLAAGANCTITVAFKPSTTGTLTAALSVTDNAAGSPQTVSLSGIGATAAAGKVTVTPSSLTFASTTVGSTSATQVVTVKNTGTVAVTLSSVGKISGTDASSFEKTAVSCGSSLAVGASCKITVACKPKLTGKLSATLSVVDNAAGSPQTVTLSGTGK